MDELSEKFQEYLEDYYKNSLDCVNVLLTNEQDQLDLFLDFVHYHNEYFKKLTFEQLTQFKDYLEKS